jgi:hypothetical protein
MIALLLFVPAFTSLVLGAVYLVLGEGRPALKVLGVAVFGAAVYLQFFSRHALAGLLLQIALAFFLALWKRLNPTT